MLKYFSPCNLCLLNLETIICNFSCICYKMNEMIFMIKKYLTINERLSRNKEDE